ncbi:MAG: putative oxygen-independent coproporphyrinogen oxidase [Actinomycetota bacterium]|jgi:putative oxygen-independent coproporphyrinogen III oxidase
MHGAYVHVPFCAKRCDYCAFATYTDRHHLTTAYLEAVREQIARAIDAGMPRVTSIFVGGGTPSMVPADELAAVIAAIPVESGAEVTVECNPDNVTVEMLRVYRDAGVNRISIGVQSTVPHVLASLGRTHDANNVRRAVEAIHDAGISTFNVDIIYGAAGESLADWQTTVRDVVALDPPHVSAYGLTVEAGTPLADDASRHPDDDDQADKYELVDDLLVAHGLENYEISNWSRPGHECQHNRLYWLQGNYHAFGTAAHGHLDGRRWWNVRTPDRYIELIEAGLAPESSSETLDEDVRRLEALQLLIRMREGVPNEAFTTDALDDLGGLVERQGERIVLTRTGRLMANEVSLRLQAF